MAEDVKITITAKDKASGVLKRIGGAFAKLGLAVAAGAAAGIAALGGLAAISLKTAISVESAFTGVAKTTDGLIDEFGKLTEVGAEIKQEFRDLAKVVPIAVEELLGIGELAGQLGVPREALVEFTETVAQLAVTTNLTQEEAATNLARLGNIYQITADDMAQNTSDVGATIVELGNNFATTERDILAFGSRLAGTGKIVGLTQADVLGIGTALSSVGVEAQAGGTAVQKVLIGMSEAVISGGKDLENFAATAGLSAAQFSEAFKEDAGKAFQLFVEGLGTQGQDAISTLSDLGLQDQRLIRSFLSLAGAGDLLGDAMDTANLAFEDGSALAKEAGLRFGTTESKLLILKNTLRDVGITIGDALMPAFQQVIQAAGPFIERVAVSIAGAIDTILVPAIENVIGWLETGLPAALEGVAAFLEPVKKGLGELVDAFLDSTPEIEEAWDDLKRYFEDTITPGLQDSFDNIGDGLENLAELWEENDSHIIGFTEVLLETILTLATMLLLGLTAIFKLITLALSGEWEKLWEEILTTFDEEMQLLFGLLKINWDEFKILWTQIFNDLSFILTTKLNEWGQSFLDFGGDVKRTLNKISRDITRFLNELARVVLPGWLVGNSPGDFELGLRGISAAMNDLTNMKMPQLARTLPGPGLAGAGAGGGGLNFTFNYSPMISLGDRAEAERVIAPIVAGVVREKLATRVT